MKLLLPPPIQQAEAEGQQQPIPPQAQAQMQQMGQQLQQMQQALQQMQQENQQLKSGAAEKQAIAQMQVAADEEIANRQMESKERIATSVSPRYATHRLGVSAPTWNIGNEFRNLSWTWKSAVKERTAETVQLASSGVAPIGAGPSAPGGNGAAPGAPPQPRLADTLIMLAQTLQQMQAVQAAPRKSTLVMDQQGNPVGAIHEPLPPPMLQ